MRRFFGRGDAEIETVLEEVQTEEEEEDKTTNGMNDEEYSLLGILDGTRYHPGEFGRTDSKGE